MTREPDEVARDATWIDADFDGVAGRPVPRDADGDAPQFAPDVSGVIVWTIAAVLLVVLVCAAAALAVRS